MIRRLTLAAALLTLVGLTALLLTPGLGSGARSGAGPQQVTLTVGDSVLVEGADVGCEITRRGGGRVFVECGRTGDAAGTYMTVVGKRTAKVARVRSGRAAKLILTAKHRGGWQTCGEPARAAWAGGRGCR